MGEIDLDGPEPLFRQIADVIARRVWDGVYQPNRKIPSEASLCDEFDVSRNTVRAAIALVNKRGLTRTVRGKGTFVRAEAPPTEKDDGAS